jgi:hypothetical protein
VLAVAGDDSLVDPWGRCPSSDLFLREELVCRHGGGGGDVDVYCRRPDHRLARIFSAYARSGDVPEIDYLVSCVDYPVEAIHYVPSIVRLSREGVSTRVTPTDLELVISAAGVLHIPQ